MKYVSYAFVENVLRFAVRFACAGLTMMNCGVAAITKTQCLENRAKRGGVYAEEGTVADTAGSVMGNTSGDIVQPEP